MHTHIHTHTSMYVALGAAATYKQRVSPGLKKKSAEANRATRLPLVSRCCIY